MEQNIMFEISKFNYDALVRDSQTLKNIKSLLKANGYIASGDLCAQLDVEIKKQGGDTEIV